MPVDDSSRLDLVASAATPGGLVAEYDRRRRERRSALLLKEEALTQVSRETSSLRALRAARLPPGL